jgi:hypothetical protein
LEARRIGEGQILEGAREIIKAGDFDGSEGVLKEI